MFVCVAPMSVSDHSGEYRETNSQSDPTSRTGPLWNGLVGGVVAVLLSMLPLSPVLGGGVAGYLERGAGRRGTGAGAIAGGVAVLPTLVVGGYLAMSPSVVLPGPELGLSPAVVVAGVTSVAVVYTVGLGVLGGLLGGYLHDEW